MKNKKGWKQVCYLLLAAVIFGVLFAGVTLDFNPASGSASADLTEALTERYGEPYENRLVEEKQTGADTMELYETMEFSVSCRDLVTWSESFNQFFHRDTRYLCQVRVTQNTVVNGQITDTSVQVITYSGYDDQIAGSAKRAYIDWDSERETVE